MEQKFVIYQEGDTAMKPRGPLMIEHRLIEKILSVVRSQIDLASD